ncbi:MAG TPA: aminomethyl-transferring glycine dehydrogenase subunit GcvPB, partial [Planctomycetes bacterium]|nr:aminomethyl-transferring glycine dehydrogenase subunit GcvPB [Planctomycetota bacterium]
MMRNRQAVELLWDQSRTGCRAVELPACDVPEVAVQELLPRQYLAEAPPPLPELTEPELVRHFVNLA